MKSFKGYLAEAARVEADEYRDNDANVAALDDEARGIISKLAGYNGVSGFGTRAINIKFEQFKQKLSTVGLQMIEEDEKGNLMPVRKALDFADFADGEEREYKLVPVAMVHDIYASMTSDTFKHGVSAEAIGMKHTAGLLNAHQPRHLKVKRHIEPMAERKGEKKKKDVDGATSYNRVEIKLT